MPLIDNIIFTDIVKSDKENFKFYLSNFEFESASTNEVFKVEDSDLYT